MAANINNKNFPLTIVVQLKIVREQAKQRPRTACAKYRTDIYRKREIIIFIKARAATKATSTARKRKATSASKERQENQA
jgi:hypothetical protein